MACLPSLGSTGQPPLPRAGRDRLLGRPGASPLGCSSSLFYLEAEMLGESKHRPREVGRKRGHPLGGCLQSRHCSPRPCSGGAPSLLPVSREAIRSYMKGGPQDISRYICSSHFSETQHRGSKVKPGGREEGLRRARVGPLQAGPRCWSGGSYLLLRSGWSRDLLPH